MTATRYVLYGMKGSGSAAIEAALELCGAPWTLVPAASWEPDENFEALKAINPLGLVPTLVLPDRSVLTESAAILMHLAERHPQTGLLPPDASSRAQALRGLVYIAAHCYAAIGIIDYPERWCTPCDDTTAERIRAGTRAKLHGAGKSSPTRSRRGPIFPANGPARSTCSPPSCRAGRARARTSRARGRRSTIRCSESTRMQPSRRCSHGTGRETGATPRRTQRWP